MIGPISGGNNTPSDIPSLVLAEVLGTIGVYAGLLAEIRPRGSASKVWRALTAVPFVVVGGGFVWTSVRELHQREIGDATAVVAFVVTVSALLVIHMCRWRKFRGWQSWPTTQATIESADVQEVRTRHSHYFVAKLSYSYQVNGDFYAGQFTHDFQREPDAWEYAVRVRGKSAAVRFHPEEFGRSRLASDEVLAI